MRQRGCQFVFVVFAVWPLSAAAQSAGPAISSLPDQHTEAGWYVNGAFALNLTEIEYYNLTTKELHFAGQQRDLHGGWSDLESRLSESKPAGVSKIGSTFVNIHTLSSIHDLGNGRGASLTFRDGATLQIPLTEFDKLMKLVR